MNLKTNRNSGKVARYAPFPLKAWSCAL